MRFEARHARPAHPVSPAELKARIEAERTGRAFLVYRGGEADQRILFLVSRGRLLTVGRDPACDVPLVWDPETSRLHAHLESVGAQWAVVDDALSRNGTFVNGERVTGSRWLCDQDVISCGKTRIWFRNPEGAALEETRPHTLAYPAPVPSPAQRRVLVALCRPFKDRARHAVPATNQEIADELVVSVPAVKIVLRALFDKFDIEGLPQNRKRSRLVELAFELGVITPHEL